MSSSVCEARRRKLNGGISEQNNQQHCNLIKFLKLDDHSVIRDGTGE